MTSKQEIIARIMTSAGNTPKAMAESFAPANIALCKYWGKRDTELNLPVTSSLSIALGKLGSYCKIYTNNEARDRVILNGTELSPEDSFVKRLSRYLDLFRKYHGIYYYIEASNSIPTAAGFASSASGFAALVKALNALHGWNLSKRNQSILARMGSGSACRSFWQGFVEWHAGVRNDGMDSYAEPLPNSSWLQLKIGLLVLSAGQKPIGSREAMQTTVETSHLYKSWPNQVAADIRDLRKAIETKNFEQLGSIAESNALAMHATMLASRPPVLYWLPESIATINKIWNLRSTGLPLYFTMDAGPNIKLIFLSDYQTEVLEQFPGLIIS